MKKIVLFILFALVLIPMGFSQDGLFRFGLKASPSLAWMRPETRGYESDGTRLGFSYGVIADYSLGEYYALSTGLQISSLGGSLSYPHTVVVITNEGPEERTGILRRDYRLRYLEIPLTLKMHTDEIGYITYYGRFGFSPGINLRARGDDNFRFADANLDPLTEEDLDIKSQTSFFRLALVVGLGMEYSMGGRTALVGGITFNNGFTNVLSGRNVNTDAAHSSVSNFLELTIGVMF